MAQTSLIDFFEASPPPLEKKMETPVLSYSQINTYQQCPLKYKYHYILQIPRPPKHYLSFGQSLHTTLDQFAKKYKERLQTVQFSDLLDLYVRSWLKEGYEDEKEEKDYWETGKGILFAFLTQIKKQNPRIIDTEKRFKLNFDEFKLAGVIDRIDERKGEWVIIDYKTGKEEKPHFMKEDLQLPIYSLAAQEIFGKKVRKVGRYYLKTLNEIIIEFSDDELEQSKDNVETIAKQMFADEEFAPKTSILCNYCDFKDICPKMQNNK